MAGRRKRWGCGHWGFGQGCHRCEQAAKLEEYLNLDAAQRLGAGIPHPKRPTKLLHSVDGSLQGTIDLTPRHTDTGMKIRVALSDTGQHHLISLEMSDAEIADEIARLRAVPSVGQPALATAVQKLG